MKEKNNFLQIIGIVLCVIMAAILITLVFMNRKRNLERAEEIQQRATDLEKEEEEKLDQAADIYEDMILDLNMNEIVCWGDGEMAGSEALSLPKALREVADENLFSPVTTEFSGIIDLEDRTIPSQEVSNMGVAHEGMNEILTRAGYYNLLIGEWTTLPGDTDPHNVVLMDEKSNILHFAEQREARFGQAIIGDIEGSLTVGEGEYDEDHPRFAFARDEEGDSLSVGRGTEVKIASSTKFLGDIPVYFFSDDTAYETDDFIDKLDSLVWWYIEEQDVKLPAAASEGSTNETAEEQEPTIDAYQFVVICTADEDSDLDNELTEKYGDHYIRNERYAHEMSEDNYKELAQKVYDLLDGQGCFDSAKAATEKALEDLDGLSVKKEH